MDSNSSHLPTIWLSCVPLIILVGLIASVVSVFGDESLSGASQIALLVASSFAIGIGLLTKRVTWQNFENAVVERVAGVSQAIIILLFIGALSSSWMVSGVVPFLIYHGVDILSPQWFLVSACVICSVVSMVTGSSWTTIATIGVALIGIGNALGFSEGWVAGAIISGAYFGDKVSPLSDTTVLASSSAGTPLFVHIHYMLYTTIPTFLITLMVFIVAGLIMGGQGISDVAEVRQGLSQTFNLSPWLMLVPAVTALMIARRMPSMAVLFLSAMAGCIAAVVSQGHLLDEIAGSDFTGLAQRFRGTMILVYGSTSLDTGVDSLNNLVATKGMSGMMGTIWLIICATIFGASMSVTKFVDSIMNHILRLIHNTVSLVASTAFVGFFLNIVCADQYLSIILTTSMFRDSYLSHGYEPRLLSRSAEDSATITSVLVPWNTCGMTQSSVLGVSTLTYLPYCIFNLLSPFMTIFITAIGFKIYHKRKAERESVVC